MKDELKVGDRVEVQTSRGILDGEGELVEITDNPSGLTYEVMLDEDETETMTPFSANEVRKL